MEKFNSYRIYEDILAKITKLMEQAQGIFDKPGSGKIKKAWVLEKLGQAIDLGGIFLPVKPYKPIALFLAGFAIDGIKAGINFIDDIKDQLPDDYVEADFKEPKENPAFEGD